MKLLSGKPERIQNEAGTNQNWRAGTNPQYSSQGQSKIANQNLFKLTSRNQAIRLHCSEKCRSPVSVWGWKSLRPSNFLFNSFQPLQSSPAHLSLFASGLPPVMPVSFVVGFTFALPEGARRSRAYSLDLSSQVWLTGCFTVDQVAYGSLRSCESS